ncbi:DUF29 domain-containing protein [uncultured Thiodictyon sp.]|uniref:DUF29 domain-containing protein n=1 Tax=uncultured Thiodictyon sp. TaxID=1846217 RepID=UPI0025CCCAF6|nr:DUF29 domain-containing protein [uncultured Thiodictyon sp.]
MTETLQTYDTDVVAWAQQQAQLLRAGRFEALDIEHIAEEIEDVGKSEQRELESRMAVLLAHLLKWHYQPERRGRSWEATIRHQRERVSRRLERTPSLKTSLTDPDWWADTWGDARLETARETGIGFDLLPADCPWTTTEILNPEFWPTSGTR